MAAEGRSRKCTCDESYEEWSDHQEECPVFIAGYFSQNEGRSETDEPNLGTCENHPNHACRCTDDDRARARALSALVAGAGRSRSPFVRFGDWLDKRHKARLLAQGYRPNPAAPEVWTRLTIIPAPSDDASSASGASTS